METLCCRHHNLLQSVNSPLLHHSVLHWAFSVRDAVSAELERLLHAGVIERIDSSPWVSPIVVVQKKTGGIRMCVDHQVPLHEDSRDLTAFITHEGLFRFCRVPYGLASAPSLSSVDTATRPLWSVIMGLSSLPQSLLRSWKKETLSTFAHQCIIRLQMELLNASIEFLKVQFNQQSYNQHHGKQQWLTSCRSIVLHLMLWQAFPPSNYFMEGKCVPASMSWNPHLLVMNLNNCRSVFHHIRMSWNLALTTSIMCITFLSEKGIKCALKSLHMYQKPIQNSLLQLRLGKKLALTPTSWMMEGSGMHRVSHPCRLMRWIMDWPPMLKAWFPLMFHCLEIQCLLMLVHGRNVKDVSQVG